MNVEIYQSYFTQDQLRHLDPEFTAFDNTTNLVPELREYAINRVVRDMAVNKKTELWGMFSWQWKQKLNGLTAQAVLDHINQNPGYDVYFFNAFSHQVPYVLNVWEQGEWCHPGIVKIIRAVFEHIGLDPNIVYKPMDRANMFWSCSCVANQKFWDGYLDLVHRYHYSLPHLPSEIINLHDSDSNYGIAKLNYFPFIQERLFSTYLSMHPEIKVLPYQHGEAYYHDHYHILNRLKATDIDLWRRMRNPYITSLYASASDLAEAWLVGK